MTRKTSYPHKIWEPIRYWVGTPEEKTIYRRRETPDQRAINDIRESSHTQTNSRIAEARRRGYTILDGNDWRLADRPKYANHWVIKICQTNGPRGLCARTVWGIKRNQEDTP